VKAQLFHLLATLSVLASSALFYEAGRRW